MDYGLTQEQKAIQQAALELAKKEFPQYAERCDAEETWPRELFETVANQGFVGVTLPSDYGGAGLGNLENVLVMEAFSRIDGGLAIAVGASSFGSEIIRHLGTEEQKQAILPKVASGEFITGAAISEANAGSDVAGVKCKAELDGDEWVLNGEKYWITNGDHCDYLVVTAMTDPDQKDRHKRLSTILVPCDDPGYTANKIKGKLGIRASSTCEVVLEDVRVPKENILGERGHGFYHIMNFFNETRILVASQGVGIAQGALDRALQYSMQREQFGQPIANFQMIQQKLAEMATSTEAARQLTYRAAWLADQGKPDAQASSMAKWYAGQNAVRVADEAVQVHGGSGYVAEMDVERFYRDAKICEIYEGTKEIHKLIIARSLLGQIR